MKRLIWLVLVILTACSSKLAMPEPDITKMQKKVPDITTEKAQQGYHLYVQFCGSCHHLYEPSRFTDKEWISILSKMFPKTKVRSVTDQQLISDYVKALSK